MIRIHLDDATRSQLTALRRYDLPAAARDRIEMVSLADAGWSRPASPPTSAITPKRSAIGSATSSLGGPTPCYPAGPEPNPTSAAETRSPAP
jgi:hypothetical protein